MNKFTSFVVTLALLIAAPISASASTLQAVNDAQFEINRVNPQSAFKNQLGLHVYKRTQLLQKCVYDFAVLGGAVSTVNLKNEFGKDCKLPNKAIIRDALIDVVTAPTSGGSATIAIGTGQAGNDIKAALAIASYTGIVAGIPVGTAATAIKLTADRTATATIATAALTAGKINVLIEYVLSE